MKSLWKLPLLWKSAKNADFTQAACKSLAKDARLHHTSFPLWDESDVRSNLPELEEFLSAGDRSWVFTVGSVNMHAHEFFRAAVEACERAGRRGILIARFAEQIPASLPPNVRPFECVPFSQVLPRAAAFAHHGGIGTMAQAPAAGRRNL